MVLPTTQFAAVLLLVACAVCWIVWVYISRRVTARWRYELYYFDVCVGFLLASILIVFTLGSLGSEMTVGDRWLVAGLREKAWTVLGGVALSLGTFLFLAGISLRDKLSPILAIAAALALNFGWIYRTRGGSLALPIFVLCVLLITIAAFGFSAVAAKSKLAQIRAKARAISAGAGIFLGGFYPAVRSGLYTDIGLGPYGAQIILGVTVVVSTLVFSIYFLNLPVNGPPIGLTAYRTSSWQQHLSGLLSGVLYAAALIAFLLGISTGSVAL